MLRSRLSGGFIGGSMLIGLLVVAACGDAGGGATPTVELPRGQAVFARYCNACHPGGGKGSGPTLRPLTMTDDEMRALVRQGKKQMPGFNSQTITNEELEDLIKYLHSLQYDK